MKTDTYSLIMVSIHLFYVLPVMVLSFRMKLKWWILFSAGLAAAFCSEIFETVYGLQCFAANSFYMAHIVVLAVGLWHPEQKQ